MQVCILLQTDKHASTPPLIGCIYITKMLSFSEEPQLHSSPICLKSENKHHWVTGNASGLKKPAPVNFKGYLSVKMDKEIKGNTG